MAPAKVMGSARRPPSLSLEILRWTLSSIHAVGSALWSIAKLTPAGKALAESYVFQYLVGSVWTTYHVFFQVGHLHVHQTPYF